MAVLLFVPPIPQWPSYHQFADQRSLWGIANFWNVISNIPFLWVGFSGFQELKRQQKEGLFPDRAEALPYLSLFVGITLTACGSAYYHLAPNNASLVWDRLPITWVVMSLVSIVLMEKTNVKIGVGSLGPLLALGVVSVFTWKWSGDLRLYGFVQFYPGLLIPLVLWLFPKHFWGMKGLVGLGIFYGAAKFCEWQDEAIYRLGGFLSGHTWKHLLAALGVYGVVWILRRRKGEGS